MKARMSINSDIERRVGAVEAKVDMVLATTQTMSEQVLGLVDSVARLDERFPQQPSKKSLISTGSIAAVLSTCVTLVLQHFGITKGI